MGGGGFGELRTKVPKSSTRSSNLGGVGDGVGEGILSKRIGFSMCGDL